MYLPSTLLFLTPSCVYFLSLFFPLFSVSYYCHICFLSFIRSVSSFCLPPPSLPLCVCVCVSRVSDPFHSISPSQIGSRRCHDPQEEKCVDSQLGSGPGTGNSGTGYYTVDQYKEILRYHFLSISVCYTGLVPVPLLGMF